MHAKPCVYYIWPACQKCFECKNGLQLQDDDKGILTGISNHPFAICVEKETGNDGSNCPSFHEGGT